MRDINKNKEYFYQYLGKKENLFKMMDLAMRQRASADDFMGENDKGIINAYKGLSLNYMLYMIAQYSAGESIETIRKSYKKTLQYSEKIWKPDSSYVDCLWLVSIGVLLDISADEICLLNHIVKKNSKEDKLISFFMEYLNKEKRSDQCFFMALPYKKLDEYIEGVKRDVTIIESYLENYWYDAHNDMAWYDSHKDKSNTYFGYWSFEAGAIAKILNLDDSSLKNAPYYPYDLVHYKEQLNHLCEPTYDDFVEMGYSDLEIKKASCPNTDIDKLLEGFREWMVEKFETKRQWLGKRKRHNK